MIRYGLVSRTFLTLVLLHDTERYWIKVLLKILASGVKDIRVDRNE